MPRLENWGVVFKFTGDPYQPPETYSQYLNGTVFGHHEIPDGTPNVTTSHIKSVHLKEEKVVTASGSVYELGTAAPEYEKLFPNARERFFKSWRGK